MVELGTRDLVEIDEGYTLGGCDIRGPLGLRFADDTSIRTKGITRSERHENGVGTCLTDITDIQTQIVTIAIDGIGYLLTLIEADNHCVGIHAVNDTTCTFLIKEIGLIVMSDGDNNPVARFQGLTDGRPQVSIEITGRHATQCLVLNRNPTTVEILAGEVAPTPLPIGAITHRTIAHGGVADEEEHGVLPLTCRAWCRTVHQGLGNGIRCVVDDFLLNRRNREVIKALG